MLILIIPIIILFIMLCASKIIKNNSTGITKLLQQDKTKLNFKISKDNNSNEKFFENIPEDVKSKVLKGNVKIVGNVNKKVRRFKNGEVIEEEETNSNNVIDKKAVQKCPNCGANLDLDLDECIYCRTKIN